MIFDKAVAAVTFKGLHHDGRNTFAYPVLRDWRADASEQSFRFTLCFTIKRRHKTEGQPSGSLGFEGEVGNDVHHYWLVNEGALKGPAVRNMVGSLCHRLTHQPGRSDGEIEAREMVHGNAGADTMTRLPDEVCDSPPELDFGRCVGFVSALIF